MGESQLTARLRRMADIEALKRSYDEREPDARRLAERLAEQLSELLASEGISLAIPIEQRLKPWQSVSAKVDRKKLSIEHIAELGDLVGLRIIVLFRRDAERVCELLGRRIHIFGTEDATDRLGTETFGYQSVHLQGKLPAAWGGLPTFRGCADLLVEIQVRTAAQHIWAAASHVLQYKQEGSVPKDVLRSINRVSALLETVDLEFERVLDQREEYASAVDTSDNSQRLNVDLLRKVLDELLPPENRADDEDYAAILGWLIAHEICTVGELRELIGNQLPEVLTAEHSLKQRAVGRPFKLTAEGCVVDLGNKAKFVTTSARRERNVWHTHRQMIFRMLILS